MMRIVAYITLGLLAYAGFLLTTFPAERAFALLGQQVPHLRASGLSGTAWSGKVALLQLQNHDLEKLQWQLKPWSILFGRLDLDIKIDSGDVVGSVRVGLQSDGGIRLTDVDMRLSATEVSTLFSVPVDLGGQFVVQLQSAQMMGNVLQSAEGLVRWQRAAVVVPSQALGEYVAQLSTVDGAVQAQIKDEGGPLQLDGVANLKPDGRYDFAGAVSVRDPQQKLLVNAVAAMGRSGKNGRVPLRYSGKL